MIGYLKKTNKIMANAGYYLNLWIWVREGIHTEPPTIILTFFFLFLILMGD